MTTTIPGSTTPPEARRRRRRGPIVALVPVIGIIAAGIAGFLLTRDSDSGGLNIFGGPDGTRPKTEAEKVEEAYRNYWDANIKAGQIPDPSSPLLAVYATSQQAEGAARDLEKLRQQGQALRSIPNSIARRQITVVSVDGDKARLTDCSVDDGIVIRTDTQKPAYEYPPGNASTTLFNAELVREFGSWKVASLTRQQRWDGVAGCAVGQP